MCVCVGSCADRTFNVLILIYTQLPLPTINIPGVISIYTLESKSVCTRSIQSYCRGTGGVYSGAKCCEWSGSLLGWSEERQTFSESTIRLLGWFRKSDPSIAITCVVWEATHLKIGSLIKTAVVGT